MERYVSFVSKNRKILIALLAVVNLLAIVGVFRIRIDPDFDAFIPNNSEAKEIYDQMEETYGSSEDLIVIVEFESETLTREMLLEMQSLTEAFENSADITGVTGPLSEETGLANIDIAGINDAMLERIETAFKSYGELSPLVFKDGSTYAVFSIFPSSDFGSKDLHELEDMLSEEGLDSYFAGNIYMQEKIFDYIGTILSYLPFCALGLLLLVFYSQLGCKKATILSVLPAGIGALWTMGLVGWIGNGVSVVTVLAPIFTIVIGSADGLHFMSHVQDSQAEGKDTETAVTDTLRMVGMPMIMTTVTSMAGFLSLLVLDNAAVRGMAVFASVGIMLAGIATWYVLPLILSGGVKLKEKSRHAVIRGNYIKKLWGTPSYIITAVLLISAIFGARSITTEFNQLMIYKERTEVYQGFEKALEINGGGVPLFIDLRMEDDPLSEENFALVGGLENALRETDKVGKVFSIYDIMSAANGAADMTGTAFQKYINLEENSARILVFPEDLNNDTISNIESAADAYAADHAEDIAAIRLTGVQMMMSELNRSIKSSQLTSLFIAFGLVFVMLLFAFKKFLPSLVSLLPIVCTVVILYGFMGFAGISLNLITVTIFSITIGVGIDYAIHFTSVWNSYRNMGCSAEDAADKAFRYTSAPILANAFGLAIGMTVLMFSPLKIHVYVSALMWVAMLSGVFLSLSLLPGILRKIKN